jgi:hypothetical protein
VLKGGDVLAGEAVAGAPSDSLDGPADGLSGEQGPQDHGPEEGRYGA